MSQPADPQGKSDSVASASTSTDQGIAASYPAREDQAFRFAPTTASSLNTISQDVIAVACLSLHDICFEFDSSFVRPETTSGKISELLSLLPRLREDHRSALGLPLLSVFGHADPVGTEDYNKRLSGRRARAVYALLTRRTDMWQTLYSDPFGGDDWRSNKSEQTMRNFLGGSAPQDRTALFKAYMAAICPPQFDKADFLGRGSDPAGKADYQGCGKLNPLLIFSQDKEREFAKPENHKDRNVANQPNRRVLIYLFRPNTVLNPKLWPCPRESEGPAGCHTRLFADATKRATPGPQDREFSQTRDTFQCRFYARIAYDSPCERPAGTVSVSYRLVVLDELESPIVGVDVSMSTPAGTVVLQTDSSGLVLVDKAPPGAASAHIVSLQQLATVMKGHEKIDRRKVPLPDTSDVSVRVTKNVLEPVVLTAEQPHRLIIVTRTDVTLPWTKLEGYEQPELQQPDGPWVLVPSDPPVLQLHSNGLGQIAVIKGPKLKARAFGPIPDPPSPPADSSVPPRLRSVSAAPPPSDPSDQPDWLRVDVDTLHQALFEKNSDAALAAIQTVHPGSAPPVEPDFPPPTEERQIYLAYASADAAAGHGEVDGDYSNTGQAIA